MPEHIQMLGKDINNGLCSTDVYKELLKAFKERDAIKMKRILANSEVDVDYTYGDPEHGTLLDLCTMHGNCGDLISLLLLHDANPNLINTARKKGPIHFASQTTDTEPLRILAECQRTDVNLLDSTGSSALHYAAKQEDSKATAVKLLIKQNADINLLNRKGKTPLHFAMEYDNIEAIKALVEAGADLNITGPDGTTLKDDLISIYPDIPVTLFNNQNGKQAYKVEVTHSQLFGLLREHKFDEFLKRVKENKHLLEQNDGCHTFLQYCCEFGFLQVVAALLEIGASPNTNNAALKQTPLMLASRRGHAGIVGILTSRPDIDFSSVDGETPIHCAVNGVQALVQTDSDYLECLNLLLTKVPKSKLNINQQDFKGNTALHYAAKLRQHKMVLLLLKHGAYIGVENVMGEAACADIAYNTFLEHLDLCIDTNDVPPREDNYEVTFNYNFLLPISWSTYYENINNSDAEKNTPINKYLQSETMPLLHIAKNRELRPLLKHPIFTSFLHLKWHRIRHYFYINLCFYLLFWAFLTTYILKVYSSEDLNKPLNGNSTTLSQINIEKDHSPIWVIVTLLLGLLFLRELFQLYISPIKYLASLENWLEIGIIVVTFIILFCKSTVQFRHQLSAIGIMLSWSELYLLIGRLPALSTNIEMLKTVSYNFLKFLAWYSILIIAFALSFYALFKDTVEQNEEENFFEDPGISVFKTVVMITGEFETGSIPFVQHPITSHILFVLFVFMIAIVLFNLLNGLAVSDTQAIRSDAELVSVVSRAKLVSYLETTLANPSTIIEALSRCLALTHKPISSINLAPSLPADHTIKVLANIGGVLTIESIGSSSNVKRDPTKRCNPCPAILTSVYMDSSVVERASQILIDKSERQVLRQAQKKDKERERMLREEIEHFRHCLNNLTQMFQENKNVLDNISKALSIKAHK